MTEVLEKLQALSSFAAFQIYFDDDSNLVGARINNWKCVFMEQRCEGTLRIWMEPFTVLRTPKIFSLRTDPFEHAVAAIFLAAAVRLRRYREPL